MINNEVTDIIGPPVMKNGWGAWINRNLFSSWFNTVLTAICLYTLWLIVPPLIKWFFINAHWNIPAEECRLGDGACWSFIVHNFRFILFGFYPFEHHWRPALAILLFGIITLVSINKNWWNRKLMYLWLVTFLGMAILMKGGIAGLTPVTADRWGGLPLTLILSVTGILFAYPAGILLALGRCSKMVGIRAICVGYIELIRGVPLISLLFMASVMFPLFLPDGVVINKLLRAQIAIILFAAAYLAETVRGGLQTIPKGQYEAASALGLSYFQQMRLIILPQALKTVIPSTVNIFISTFKDTSLVVIVALFDLLATTKASLANPEWLGFSREGYIFVAVIYFTFCFSMSRFSINIEKELNRGY